MSETWEIDTFYKNSSLTIWFNATPAGPKSIAKNRFENLGSIETPEKNLIISLEI